MLVLLLDGSEKFDRHHVSAIADADMVIGSDGEVIKAKGDGPARRKVELEGQKERTAST